MQKCAFNFYAKKQLIHYPLSYLSDDQRSILGRRGGLVALRVLQKHGLCRLCLPVTQPPAEAMGISDVRNQTSVNTHAEKKPCSTCEVTAYGFYYCFNCKERDRQGQRSQPIIAALPTQPWSPRPLRWTPLPPPGPPPHRLPRRWCPSPRLRRNSR